MQTRFKTMCFQGFTRFLCFVVHLLTLSRCVNSLEVCPPECSNSCVYNNQGEITEAQCSDIYIPSLPTTLVRLRVFDAVDSNTLPSGIVTKHTMHGKANLQLLKIENYHITSLTPDCFQESHDLRSLDLSNNNILHIDRQHFTGLQHLTYLNLNSNQVHDIGNFTFQELTALTELHIALNKILAIREHDFAGLNALTKLDLQSNAIGSIHPAAFYHLGLLQEISLQENNLTHIGPGLFQNMSNLHKIDLQKNKIITLDPNCLFGTYLVDLDLGQNELREIPTKLLAGTGSLNLTAKLDKNRIHHLPANVFNGVVANTVSLEINNITLIHPDALNNSFILKLDLQHNYIHHISEGLKKHMNQSNQLLLADNPMNCTCDIEWIVVFLSSTDKEPTCEDPKNYFHSKVSDALKDLNVSCKSPQMPLPAPPKALPVPPKQNPVIPRLQMTTTTTPITTTVTRLRPINITTRGANSANLQLNDKGDNSNSTVSLAVGVTAGILALLIGVLFMIKLCRPYAKVLPDPILRVYKPDQNFKQRLKYIRSKTAWSEDIE